MQPDSVNLWYFKLRLFNLAEFIVWNIVSLRHWIERILNLENQSLYQRFNSFLQIRKKLFVGACVKFSKLVPFTDFTDYFHNIKNFASCKILAAWNSEEDWHTKSAFLGKVWVKGSQITSKHFITIGRYQDWGLIS